MKRSIFSAVALSISCVLLHAAPASAETTARVIVRTDALPLTTAPVPLSPTQVTLPNARHGGKVPASWGGEKEPWSFAVGRCLEGRRASISNRGDTERESMRIVTLDGKDFLDRATVSIAGGIVSVTKAQRTPLVKLMDDGGGVVIHAYLRPPNVFFVYAVDSASHRAGSFGCEIIEGSASLTGGSFGLASSATAAEQVMRWSATPPTSPSARRALPRWIGADFVVEGSVSRSKADNSSIISLLTRAKTVPDASP